MLVMQCRVDDADCNRHDQSRRGTSPQHPLHMRIGGSWPAAQQRNSPRGKHRKHDRQANDAAFRECCHIQAVRVRAACVRGRIINTALLAYPALHCRDVDVVEVVEPDPEPRVRAERGQRLIPHRVTLIEHRIGRQLRELILPMHFLVERLDRGCEHGQRDRNRQHHRLRLARPQPADQHDDDQRDQGRRSAAGKHDARSEQSERNDRADAKTRGERGPERDQSRQDGADADRDVRGAMVDVADRMQLDALVLVRDEQRNQCPQRGDGGRDRDHREDRLPLALPVPAALQQPYQ